MGNQGPERATDLSEVTRRVRGRAWAGPRSGETPQGRGREENGTSYVLTQTDLFQLTLTGQPGGLGHARSRL